MPKDNTTYTCELSADLYELLDIVGRNCTPRTTVPQLCRLAVLEFCERVAEQVEAQARLQHVEPASPEVPHV